MQSQGEIALISILNIKDVDYSKFDEVWAIVRTFKHPTPNIKHIPELSPSWYLLKTYLSLKKSNRWNQETFNTYYLPQFLFEMKTQQFQNKLTEIEKMHYSGKNICLVCFCPEESLCHRSIIAGYFQNKGIPVLGVSKNYSRYFKKNRIYIRRKL